MESLSMSVVSVKAILGQQVKLNFLVQELQIIIFNAIVTRHVDRARIKRSTEVSQERQRL